ncbi:MAG: hypothetical protein ACE5J7_05250 [Candidatus Aenigmatarchaeota archaeon]
MAFELFHIIHHSLEIAFSILILYATFLAIKNFKLVIWKRGWYAIGIGAAPFLIVEVAELLEVANYLEITPLLEVPLHSIHIGAFAFFAIGIYLLAKSAAKLWGGKK